MGHGAAEPELRNSDGEHTRPACEFGRRAQTFDQPSARDPSAKNLAGRGSRRDAENHTPEVYAPGNALAHLFSISEFGLNGLRYRQTVLNLQIEGEGQRIARVLLDGKPVPSVFLPATLTGEHQATINPKPA